ncbi:MAG TPA: hypothetical protein QGF58_18725 [Myxococcota bacterium]|nr:hypothetical protein [Myxococcota bacterium]
MTALILLACETEEPRYSGAADPPCADQEPLEPSMGDPVVLDGGREDYGRLGYGSAELLMHYPVWTGPHVTGGVVTLLSDGYEEIGTWDTSYYCVVFITNHYTGAEPQAIAGCYDGMYELVPGEEPDLMDVDHTFYAASEDDYDGDGVDDVFDRDGDDWTAWNVTYGDGTEAHLTVPGTYIYWGIGEGDWNGDGVLDQSHLWDGTGLGILYGGTKLEGNVAGEDVMVLGEGTAYERALHAGDMDGDGYSDIMIGYGGKTGVVRGAPEWTGPDLNDAVFSLVSKSGNDTIPMGWSDLDGDYVSDPIVGVQNGDYQDVYALRYCDEGGVIWLEDVGALIDEDVVAPLEEAFPIDLDADREFEIMIDGNYILRVYEI